MKRINQLENILQQLFKQRNKNTPEGKQDTGTHVITFYALNITTGRYFHNLKARKYFNSLKITVIKQP